MVEFRCYRRSEDHTPVIRDVDIVRYARNVLYDYAPAHLERPGKLDADHFIEHYMRANIEIQHIYTDTRNDLVAGAAIFNLQKIKVFSKEDRCAAEIIVPPNTVIIDDWTDKHSPFGFREFTMMHEAGHLLMHQEVYRQQNEEGIYTTGTGCMAARTVTPIAALCKRSMVGWGGKPALETSEDFREHQVNTFAGAMLMPPQTFIPYVRELIYEQGYNSGIFTIFRNDSFKKTYTDYRKILFRAAREFGVSHTAVDVQMKKYGLYTSANNFSEARRRLMMYMNI